MENLFTPDCIRTVSGKYVNVFDPKPDMFCIEDIAHALANQSRFGGHLPRFYSVAQHSLACCWLMDDPALKLQALLHDASEAYLLDIPSPIKKGLPDYKKLEAELMDALAELFGFQFPFDPQIKGVDAFMLKVEWEALMLGKESFEIKIMSPAEAERRFLATYYELTNSSVETKTVKLCKTL